MRRTGEGYCQEAYHHKRFHFIFKPDRHLVNVHNCCISARFHTTVRFNRLKYSPPVVTITDVTRKPEGNEERFDSFRTVKKHVDESLTYGEGLLTVTYILRHMEAILLAYPRLTPQMWKMTKLRPTVHL